MKRLLEGYGATVVGLAVIIYQPTPNTLDFGNLPLYYLAFFSRHANGYKFWNQVLKYATPQLGFEGFESG